jgi:hypothetical protein
MNLPQPLVEVQPRLGVLGLAYILRDTLNAFIAIEEAQASRKTEQLMTLAKEINESAQRHQADYALKPSSRPQ